jgi:biotin transport system substrate-specific component
MRVRQSHVKGGLRNMSDVFSVDRPKPVVLADLIPKTVVRDVLLVVGAACTVGLLAQISIHLPSTPVPITGQTLGVLVAGTSLGWKRGVAAMVLYASAGVAGLPWFADHGSGYVGASFGYILGFILCAGVCGFLAEKGADRTVLKSVPAMVIGELAMYTAGVVWLGVCLHVGIAKAIALGFTPFLIGDSIKAAIAALSLPGVWRLTKRQ